MPLTKVIIVGAGPSGLLLALLLARAHVPVELLEQTHSLDTNPRASHYTSESCIEFDRAGILDEVRAQGFLPDGVSWRRLDENKTRLVALHNAIDDDDETGAGRYRMVCLPLHKLGKILEGRYGHKVVEIGENEARGKAWVRVEKEGGEAR
ncbi:hypothetical protein NEMBOFW57_010676 [Staphylotrichum longicolle]|uniref:FAD-binding domain-containing protein n=1 Tax=Staphylotrichum longicolle TaxID=669026 RepID=A0AAD4ENG2_9PEZI|nr:hypothetical protein NEMBOFW57_010676 [Staphylotrichum longicolle]